MIIYIFVNLIILVLGLFHESIRLRDPLNNTTKILPRSFFVIPSFIVLFIISAFRGDFTTDYNNYANLFELYNRFDFIQTFQVGLEQEVGYIFLSRIIGFFTNEPIYLFAAVTLITLSCFYSQINKYSPYLWISVLLLINIGLFYTSFNIMRQILAVAIVFAGSKFLYERKPIKYLLVIILASSIHTTALIMFVFYFILNLKVNLKNLIFILIGSIALILGFDRILSFVQTFFYTAYTQDSYGMTGLSFTNALLPIALLIFCLFNLKKLDKNNIIHRIWLNAIIFYAVFNILGLQVQMVRRVSYYFAPFVLLLIPFLLSKMKHKELRPIYIMIVTALLIIYNYIGLRGTEYDPYYFIWDA